MKRLVAAAAGPAGRSLGIYVAVRIDGEEDHPLIHLLTEAEATQWVEELNQARVAAALVAATESEAGTPKEGA